MICLGLHLVEVVDLEVSSNRVKRRGRKWLQIKHFGRRTELGWKDDGPKGKWKHVVRTDPAIRDYLDVIKRVHDFVERDYELRGKGFFLLGKCEIVRVQDVLLVAVQNYQPEWLFSSMVRILPFEVASSCEFDPKAAAGQWLCEGFKLNARHVMHKLMEDLS